MKNSEYHKKRYGAWKQTLLDFMGGKCVRCGTTDNLEIDHIDRKTKSFTVCSSAIWKKPVDIIEELLKCQLLCESCHMEKTRSELGVSKHGSLSMYAHHRCRCVPCKNVHNEASRRWKITHRKKWGVG